MKKLYVVSYDYQGSPEKYQSLFNQLKNFQRWWHYIDGTWLIVTEDDAEGVYAKLAPYLDEDINLLVIEVGHDVQGWLPEHAWKWEGWKSVSPTEAFQ